MHEKAKRGDPRPPATDENRHGYTQSGIGEPPPDLNGKEEALGSNPREGLGPLPKGRREKPVSRKSSVAAFGQRL